MFYFSLLLSPTCDFKNKYIFNSHVDTVVVAVVAVITVAAEISVDLLRYIFYEFECS